MMSVHVMKLFQGAVVRANLSSNSSVAVAVSGGCDSMALLWLARQTFPNLLGLTVDHRLRVESTEEAGKVAHLVTALGVRHHLLTLQWAEPVPTNTIQLEARVKRYDALLEYCESQGITTLMTAHHRDDQIETLVYRMSMGSGVDGLAGMCEVSRRVAYPNIQLVRPLLACRKEQLRGMCEEEGVGWVEDPSNRELYYKRNYIRHVLENDPGLREGLYHMHNTLVDANKSLHSRLKELLISLPTINSKYGYISLPRASLLQLPPPLLRRLLSTFIQYMSADIRPVPYQGLTRLVSTLPDLPVTAIRRCYVFHLDKETIGICAAPEATPVPIEVEKQLHWNGMWEVELSGTDNSEQYFIRPFHVDDHVVLRRAEGRCKLPPLRTRGALPVLTDKNRTVLAIPHFNYTAKTSTVLMSVRYKPLLSFSHFSDKCTQAAD